MVYGQEYKDKYFALRGNGLSQVEAAQRLGIHVKTVQVWERKDPHHSKEWRELRLQNNMPGPITEKRKLSPEALRALDDFAYWRWRYLGRRTVPWQIEAAANITTWLKSPSTEFVVVNCPPGSGKSTLFTSDIPAWLICRDRTIRIMIGSSSHTLARTYTNRIRRALERTRPLQPNAKNHAEGAMACIAQDYGRFRPESTDIWRQDEFTVAVDDDEPLEDKESTCTAFGEGSEFLGIRADFVIWDDLVTDKSIATPEKIESQRKWFEENGETRVEPGGCLVLQGQRMGAEDLYRHALDMVLGDDAAEDSDRATKYRHIVYKAHYDELCTGNHKDLLPYPDSCLLDPTRLPWLGASGLNTIRRNREQKYQVQYQQEDVDSSNVLVQKIWVDGGRGHDGILHPGCLDRDRALGQIPDDITRPFWSVASVDPSPSKYWAIEWFIYHPATEQRFLIDIFRSQLEAPGFLDINPMNGIYSGLAEDWQERSVRAGYPISHWIVENNAAQRFLLQYPYVKAWQRRHNVQIVAHATGRNKLDEEYGIRMLQSVYEFGKVRLPGYQITDNSPVRRLINEATRYPLFGGTITTDDCLMAQWFFEFHLPKLSRPPVSVSKQSRPSFVRRMAHAR